MNKNASLKPYPPRCMRCGNKNRYDLSHGAHPGERNQSLCLDCWRKVERWTVQAEAGHHWPFPDCLVCGKRMPNQVDERGKRKRRPGRVRVTCSNWCRQLLTRIKASRVA